MRIYIDEAGLFTAPRTGTDSYSLVLALVIPSAVEAELFYDFLRLRDSWPVKGVEIKGSSLDETQTAQVIDILLRYDVLVQFKASVIISKAANSITRKPANGSCRDSNVLP